MEKVVVLTWHVNNNRAGVRRATKQRTPGPSLRSSCPKDSKRWHFQAWAGALKIEVTTVESRRDCNRHSLSLITQWHTYLSHLSSFHWTSITLSWQRLRAGFINSLASFLQRQNGPSLKNMCSNLTKQPTSDSLSKPRIGLGKWVAWIFSMACKNLEMVCSKLRFLISWLLGYWLVGCWMIGWLLMNWLLINWLLIDWLIGCWLIAYWLTNCLFIGYWLTNCWLIGYWW